MIFLFLLFFSSIPFYGQAGLVPCGNPQDDPSTPGIDESKPCQFCHFFVLFKNIIDFVLFKIVPPLAILMIVVAGAMYMLAYIEAIGNPNWISQAKSLIWAVVIGLIIIYGAWLLVNLFFQIIGVESWTNLKNWWQINCPI